MGLDKFSEDDRGCISNFTLSKTTPRGCAAAAAATAVAAFASAPMRGKGKQAAAPFTQQAERLCIEKLPLRKVQCFSSNYFPQAHKARNSERIELFHSHSHTHEACSTQKHSDCLSVANIWDLSHQNIFESTILLSKKKTNLHKHHHYYEKHNKPIDKKHQ